MTIDRIVTNLEDKPFQGSAADNEFWTIECLVDKLFLRLTEVKEIVKNNDKEIHVRKYYRQARELFKWIPIAKPIQTSNNIPIKINKSKLKVKVKVKMKERFIYAVLVF